MNLPVILCVDDEPTILDSLAMELKAFLGRDYFIETAENGEEALELVEELITDGYEIALIISDYIMPGVKGDELLKRIHLTSPKTIKIMLTGQADIEAVSNAVNSANLYRYITKPWEIQDFNLTIKEALNRYIQEQKLEEQNKKLQQTNQTLEQLNQNQITLISELQENELRLRQFLEAMPVGVAVLDGLGQLYYINQKAQKILNQDKDKFIKLEHLLAVDNIYIAGTDQLYPQEEFPLNRALKGEYSNVDDIEINHDNKVIPLEVWGTPIFDAEGKVIYAIAALADITERKKADSERQQFTEHLTQLNQAFSRFVPRQFLYYLNKTSVVDIKLGDNVQQDMSVLFAGIRSFTALSEQMTPEDNFKFINAYFSRMESAITDNQGFVDKYIGDTIMALFSGSADDAVKAGIAMLHQLAQYNLTRQRPDRKPLEIGIGINTGLLMLGTVGGQSRMDGTVISDAVNLASRLEKLTKHYGVSLLISHYTFTNLTDFDQYNFRLIDRLKVRGKAEAVSIFEVFDGDRLEIRQAKLATKTLFEEGLLHYYCQRYQEAERNFQKCLYQNPWDKVAQIYLQRTQQQL